jgi:hypothetical protein
MARIRFGDSAADEGIWNLPDLPKTTVNESALSGGSYQTPTLPKTTTANPDLIQAGQNAFGPYLTQPTGTDLRSQFSSVYSKYGLDPTNPGSGLADVNYFLTRLNQTDPNDSGYWLGKDGQAGRLEQEIRKALYGEVGPLIDTNAGASKFGYDDPSAMTYLSAILDRIGQLKQPRDESVYNLLKSLSLQRVNDLNAPPYTSADEAAMRAHYLEPLTQARDAALTRNKERASMAGYLPSSGLVDRNNQQVETAYERAVGSAANETALGAIQEKQRRGDQQLAILDNLLRSNNTQDDRSNALSDEVVQLSKLFPDFDASRLAALLQAGGDSGAASSGISGLLGAGNLNLNSQLVGSRSSNALGQFLGYLLANGLG